MIILQVIYLITVPYWFLFTVFATVGPHESSVPLEPWVRGMLWLLWGYPVAIAVASVAGWVLFTRTRYGRAALWMLLPLLWALPAVGINAASN